MCQSASLYVRLSREAGDANLSLQGMVDETRAFAEAQGYEVSAVHVDNGKSGALRNRPAFTAWLEDGRSGRADCLVAFHTDRVTREGISGASGLLLDVIEGTGYDGQRAHQSVRFMTVADRLDSRDGESFQWRFGIGALQARGDRTNIVRRNKATRTRLTEAGRWTGGVVPYGCMVVVRDGGKYLEASEAEAQVLRDVAGRLLRGDSFRSVIGWMDGQGHRTRRGKLWQRTTVKSALLCEPVRRHVLDAATNRALAERFAPKAKGEPVPGRGRPNTNLLSGGLARCGSCGSTLTTAGKVGANRRYTCLGKSKGQQCDGGATISAAALDERIEREFLEHYGHQYALELRVTVSGAESLDAAEKDYEAAQVALREELTEESFRAAQDARRRLEAAQGQPLTRERQIWTSDETYGEQWAAADVPGRSAMLHGALARPVVVEPGRPLNSASGRGKVPNIERAVIVWRDEVNPEDY